MKKTLIFLSAVSLSIALIDAMDCSLISTAQKTIPGQSARTRQSARAKRANGSISTIRLRTQPPSISAYQKALKTNDHQTIIECLKNGADPTISIDGMQPIHYAARAGATDIVRLLLEKYDIDVNCSDDDGLTPLSHSLAALNYYQSQTPIETIEYFLNQPNLDDVYDSELLDLTSGDLMSESRSKVLNLFIKYDYQLDTLVINSLIYHIGWENPDEAHVYGVYTSWLKTIHKSNILTGTKLIKFCLDYLYGEYRDLYVDFEPQLDDVIIVTVDHFGLPLLQQKVWGGKSLLEKADEKLLTALSKKSTVFKEFIKPDTKTEKSRILLNAVNALFSPPGKKNIKACYLNYLEDSGTDSDADSILTSSGEKSLKSYCFPNHQDGSGTDSDADIILTSPGEKSLKSYCFPNHQDGSGTDSDADEYK